MVKQGVLLVVGKKGSGKTNLVREFLNEQDRYLAVDVHGEFGGTIIEDPHSLVAWINRNRHLPRWRVSYRDRGLSDIDPRQVFKALHNLQGCWLVLDEASLWKLMPEAEWFFAQGRHNEISIAATVQRAHQIGPTMRAQVDVIVSFKQKELRDLDWIEEAAGPEKRAEVATLGEYEWTYIECDHDEIEATLDAISTEEGGESDAARLDTGSAEHGASGDRGAPVVGAPEVGEGSAGARSGAEGAGHPRVADPAGPAGDAGEARDGGPPDRADQHRPPDGNPHRGGGRRKARQVG